MQCALQMELHIAPFIGCFQTGTLGTFYEYMLSVLGKIYLNNAFLLNFRLWKVIYRALYESSCLLLLS